jgi:hypothetical protein
MPRTAGKEVGALLYMSPPVKDKALALDNSQHHPMCSPDHVPAGCLHWSHHPWVADPEGIYDID